MRRLVAGSTWGGRRATAATTAVLIRDQWVCWLCRHPGANSLDHITPRNAAPELTWDPANHAAAHLAGAGHPDGCPITDCRCPGNTGRRAHTTPPPSRDW